MGPACVIAGGKQVTGCYNLFIQKTSNMPADKEKFIQLVRHPIRFRAFLFSRLPAAFFSGVRVKTIDDTTAIVTVPYRWFSKNPFKSTYFACLAMAAEMSTGLLAMMTVYKSDPPISMLVTGLEASYFKKATGRCTFTCNEGLPVRETIDAAIETKTGKSIRLRSAGINTDGELVAEFFITWSFKVKG